MPSTLRIQLNKTLLCLFFYCALGYAQEIPPIVNYSTKDYQAENQNWSISQAEDRVIYVANNKGLLEFNGAYWNLYPSPNETIMRSVVVAQDKIYTGCYMEFGYWKHDSYDKLMYTSLSEKISESLITDEEFWNIIVLEDYVLFQSFSRIYIYNVNLETFNIIESEDTLTKMVEVDGEVYFQKLNLGIFKIENGKSKLVIDDLEVSNSYLVNIYQIEKGLLIQTQNNGFILYDGKGIFTWNSNSKEKLKEISIYSSIQLENNSFAIGTISNGIIFLKQNGEIDYTVNQSSGLNNNTVLSLFQDLDLNIWLGLDNGIDCLNTNAAFRVFRDNFGKLGTVYAAEIYRDKIYIGTNQGLFYRATNTNQDFTLVEGSKGQVWNLKVYDDQLFVGHNSGSFVCSGGTMRQLSFGRGTWIFKEIDDNPNLLIQGNYDGISVLEKKDGAWRFRNKISGYEVSSKYLEISRPNEIFINHEYKGVYKLMVNKALTRVIESQIDTILSKGLNSSLIKYNDEVLYAYRDGVFKFDKKKDTFVKDSLLSQFYSKDNYISGKLIEDTRDNKLWGFNYSEISFIEQGQLSNKPNFERIAFPFDVRRMMIGYENMLNLKDNVYLIGTSAGYILIDLDKLENKDSKIFLNSIESFTIDFENTQIDRNESVNLDNRNNNLKFSFSTPVYDKFNKVQYQYKLEGIYDKWSEWSDSYFAIFKNLPSGEYTFKVRGKVGNSLTKNNASFAFSIKKPWYSTNLAISFYLLLFTLFIALMHTAYRANYKKQKNRLILENKRDLELKQLENDQDLMQLKNEKLQQDIDNKNRELAISTMSLIKKNEFLNSIKEELKKSKSKEVLNSVVKIIDKNINNNDDWTFFQEAFNNADKNFLKKVKSIHPNLTPNDLRLCAYLRLNLTSKEIAPLLNISPRSVEVKRYRLRKKMNLSHEDGLTDYILKI